MAISSKIKTLVEQGDRLFSKRSSLDSLWQQQAEQFYVERADFTTKRSIGTDYAANLMTGRPVMARRDLANSFSAMLRPRGRPWFHARTDDEDLNRAPAERAFLDHISERMRRLMYDPRSQFIRSTKEGDNDFATFGQCVIEPTPNRNLDGILFRCWHLRDVAWCDNAELQIDTVHRKWNLEAAQLCRLFPKTVSTKVREMVKKEPYREVKCRHIVLPADAYDLAYKPGQKKQPYVSIYVDIEHQEILEELPAPEVSYVIPRWVTVSGSQYAHSPATVVALPDARLLQQITLTLLEAGQKVVDPPMIAVKEAISGGVNTWPGAITWADLEYDERLGEVLRQMDIKAEGLNWGDKREAQIHAMISEAFYLNQIQVPYPEGDMTATEFRGRVEEYVRRAMPLFEPMEVEYNGGLCERVFSIGNRLGRLGRRDARGVLEGMPDTLDGADIRWQFESPLQAANERAKSQAFLESMNLLNVAAQADPNARFKMNVVKAFGDALKGTGAPADWEVDDREVAARIDQAHQAQQLEQTAAVVQKGADVAGQIGGAAQQLQLAGIGA